MPDFFCRDCRKAEAAKSGEVQVEGGEGEGKGKGKAGEKDKVKGGGLDATAEGEEEEEEEEGGGVAAEKVEGGDEESEDEADLLGGEESATSRGRRGSRASVVLDRVREFIEVMWRFFFKWWYEPMFYTESQKAMAKIRKERSTIADLAATLVTAKKEAKTDFGSDGRFYRLWNKCFDGLFSGYKYTMCPYGRFEQRLQTHGAGKMTPTLLGTYIGWFGGSADHYLKEGKGPVGVMHFRGGAGCPGAGPRQADVIMRCGERDEILSVTEDSTCKYVVRFSTPAVCSQGLVDIKLKCVAPKPLNPLLRDLRIS